jgi:hypothetical protein
VAVVVANDPMPSVSKKLVMAPVANWAASGTPRASPGVAAFALARSFANGLRPPAEIDSGQHLKRRGSPMMGFMPGTTSW